MLIRMRNIHKEPTSSVRLLKDSRQELRTFDRFGMGSIVVLTCKEIKLFTLGAAHAMYSWTSVMSMRKRDSREVGVGCAAQFLKLQREV